MNTNQKLNFDHLVITGGGVKGIIVIGSLKYLEENGYLKKFKSYSGTSIGGVISFLLSIGYTVKELEILFTKLEAKHFFDIDIGNFLTEYGFCSVEPLGKLFRSCGIQKEIPKDCTFQKHFELTNKLLQITGSNLNTTKSEIFSYKTTPNMCVYKALEITIAYPFVFKPVEYNGCIYSDGGLTKNTPIDLTPDPKNSLVLSLCLSNRKECPNIFKYISMLTSFLLRDVETFEKYKYNYINLSVPNCATFNFKLTEEDKINMINNGFDRTFHFFNEKLNNYYENRLIKKYFYILRRYCTKELKSRDLV